MADRRQAQPQLQRQRRSSRMHPGMLGDKINHSLRRRQKPGVERSEINPCVKYFLFFLNFFLLLLGIGMVSLGTYILVLKEKSVTNWIDFFFDPAVFIFCFGGANITVLSFCGAFGSLRENTFLLKAYSLLMAFYLLIEVVAVIGVFIFYFMPKTFADMGLYPEDLLKDAIPKYRDDQDSTTLIDDIQETFSCCGVTNDDQGYLGWNDNTYFRCNGDNYSPEACSVPHSCCRISAGQAVNYQCGQNMLSADMSESDRMKAIYTQGCLKGLEVKIKDNIWIIGGVIIGVLLPQAFFICLAKALVFQVKEQKINW